MGLTLSYADSKDVTTDTSQVKLRMRKVTFDNSYADDGEAIAASDFGFTRLFAVIPLGPATKSDYADAVAVAWRASAAKLVAYRQLDPAAVGGADVALPEVADTTDLSGYSVYVIGVGL